MIKFFKSNLFFFVVLTLLVFTVYAKSINYELTNLDDDVLTSKKSLYISDIKNFPKFFVTDCYHNKNFTQYYRPVLSLSFAIETILFDVNTKVYHITNIILFILALYLMYLFLCKLGQNKTILKFIILVFCVHPIFVSTVVWIPARNDTLLAVFIFLFLINYVNYIRENKILSFLLSVIFFVFSLFTKETAVAIFPIMALIIYCFNLKISKKQILNYSVIFIPFFIIYFLLRQIAVAPVHFSRYIEAAYSYVLNLFYGTMLYIKYMLAFNDIPIMLNNLQFDLVSFIFSFIVVILLTYLYVFKIIDRKIIIFSITVFFLFLFPTFAQEHKFYIWLSHRLIVSFVSILFVLSEIINKLIIKYNNIKKYIYVVLLILLIPFSFSSYIQADKYKDSKSFWMNSYSTANEYGLAMEKKVEFYTTNKKYDDAKELILKLLEQRKDIKYYLDLINIDFLINKDLDLAEKNYLQCLKSAKSPFYRAKIFFRLSQVYYMKTDLNKAIEYAEQSVENSPYDKEALLYLANYYALNKQFSKARPIYEKLLNDDKNNKYYKYLIKTLDEDEQESKNI